MPAMPDDWNEATLSWGDVPNLAPLDEAAAVNATRSNFVRCVSALPWRQELRSAKTPLFLPAGATNNASTRTSLTLSASEGVPKP